MKIYKLYGDFENYDSCVVDKEACRELNSVEHLSDLELYIDFDGSSQVEKWWPRKFVRNNNGNPLGDYITNIGGGDIVLEQKAIEKLKPLMKNVEVLPIDCDFGDYWIINVLDVLKCIDYEKSKYLLLSDELEEGRPHIMRFEKYEFIKGKIEGYNVFKIVDEPKTHIFVNEVFVNAVKEFGITGFSFQLLWED